MHFSPFSSQTLHPAVSDNLPVTLATPKAAGATVLRTVTNRTNFITSCFDLSNEEQTRLKTDANERTDAVTLLAKSEKFRCMQAGSQGGPQINTDQRRFRQSRSFCGRMAGGKGRNRCGGTHRGPFCVGRSVPHGLLKKRSHGRRAVGSWHGWWMPPMWFWHERVRF
jgi:hypothetical protein